MARKVISDNFFAWILVTEVEQADVLYEKCTGVVILPRALGSKSGCCYSTSNSRR